MPAVIDSSALLVARFLKANDYTQSFTAFIEEAGLTEADGDTKPQDLTVERLLDEKQAFDKSLSFKKLSLSDDSNLGWMEPAPSQSISIPSMNQAANILSIAVASDDDTNRQILFASASDKSVVVAQLPSLQNLPTLTMLHDAPTLAQAVVSKHTHLATTMSGKICVSDLKTGKLVQERKDHDKFVVCVEVYQYQAHHLIATAGWDNKIVLYKLDSLVNAEGGRLSDPIATLKLNTKPEAIAFVQSPDTQQPVLIVSRSDSSHLHFYDPLDGLKLLGKQNLAPHSNAWVAFTPSSFVLSPIDPTLLAVATNSTPHMRLLVVRLLFPKPDEAGVHETSLEQARAAQAVAEREDMAIRLQCNAMAPQTLYSTPLVVWRPDGKGVWVNSDDGIIRGIDTTTGKVVRELRAHKEGSKIRALWSGLIKPHADVREDEEWLLSGAFDHKLLAWRPLTT